MNLREQLAEEQKTAMREKDADTLSTIRLVLAAVKNTEIDRGTALSDQEIQDVIARQVKQLHDALKDFIAGGRQDLIDKTQNEIALLERYLPKQLTDDELEAIVKTIMATIGTTSKQDFGKIMGAVTKETKGKADGNRVKQVVEKLCV